MSILLGLISMDPNLRIWSIELSYWAWCLLGLYFGSMQCVWQLYILWSFSLTWIPRDMAFACQLAFPHRPYIFMPDNYPTNYRHMCVGEDFLFWTLPISIMLHFFGQMSISLLCTFCLSRYFSYPKVHLNLYTYLIMQREIWWLVWQT